MAESQKIQKVETSINLPKDYSGLLEVLKKQIRTAQIKASLAVNRELILLYYDIGKRILERQDKEGWGTKVVDRLAIDLRKEFPEMKGLSSRNLKYMRGFAQSYPDLVFVQQLAAQIPWFHNCTILDKIKSFEERKFYIFKTIENGWIRAVLVHQIESDLYGRQAGSEKLTNFVQTLADPQSDLAHEILKDPYNFEFLNLDGHAKERKLHKSLIKHLQDFLIELGVGFAFVGSEYHLEIGDQDFYIDLLFYHLKLHCYVVIELKTVAFQPEFAGKMNFYLSAVDDMVKQEEDKPTIGIVLCQSKNKTVVEYALKDSKKPMGVSSYKLTHSLPEQLKGQLPTVKQLKEGLKQ